MANVHSLPQKKKITEDVERVLTSSDLLQVVKANEEAYKDETPFLVQTQDELAVVGDANKTEVKTNTYEVHFRLPRSHYEVVEDDEIVGNYFKRKVTFENAYITAQQDLRLVDLFIQFNALTKKINQDDNGKLSAGEYTDEELSQLLARDVNGNKLLLVMYNIVATFLKIDDELGENMYPASVFRNTLELVQNHPELSNEAETFFGGLSRKT